MSKEEYDPLRLLIAGNKQEKAAYEYGVAFGREKERKILGVLFQDVIRAVDKRAATILSLKERGQCKPRFLKRQSPNENYIHGLKDAMKLVKQILRYQP